VNRARRLRPSEIDALVERYEATRSVKAVAREFNITRQTVGKHLAERGIETVRRMSEAEVTSAVEQYVDGESAATIGRRLGFDPQTVLSALRAEGIAIRPRPGIATR
jgi:DNA-binding CsgD family transcriptional regulator